MENKVDMIEDQAALLQHISRYGSDGYPIHKVGLGCLWSWKFNSIGTPQIFRTRREAAASFERYYQMLLDRKAKRSQHA
jgi:hypothetical protein